MWEGGVHGSHEAAAQLLPWLGPAAFAEQAAVEGFVGAAGGYACDVVGGQGGVFGFGFEAAAQQQQQRAAEAGSSKAVVSGLLGSLQAELGRMTAREVMDAKALAASRSHSEAERRRRQRINGHLARLRSLLPNTTKGHSEWKKLQHGPPECEELLKEMFGMVAVDGSSSCIPGEFIGGGGAGAVGGGGGAHGEGVGETHVGHGSLGSKSKGTNPLKRGSSSTATSPQKIGKNPMVKIMKGIHNTLENNCVIANKVMQGELRYNSIKEVMNLAVECGAAEGTAEHFMATQLFVKAEHRDMFKTFTTKEGRLDWLKRWCVKEGLM